MGLVLQGTRVQG